MLTLHKTDESIHIADLYESFDLTSEQIANAALVAVS